MEKGVFAGRSSTKSMGVTRDSRSGSIGFTLFTVDLISISPIETKASMIKA